MKKLFVLCAIIILSGTVSAQTKTMTNAELEKFRQERLKAEEDYRKNYDKMGFPSPAELEKINAEKRRELSRTADRLRREKYAAQNDIFTRANSLRSQIASVNAQIEFLRTRGARPSNQTFYYSSYGYANYGYRAPRPVFRSGNRQSAPNFVSVTGSYPNSPSSVPLSISPNRRSNDYEGRNYRRGFYFVPVIVGGYYPQTDTNGQLQYLEQVRAGLWAEWRIVEEEARRAGIRLDL